MSCPHTFQASNRKKNQICFSFFIWPILLLWVLELVCLWLNNQRFQRVDDLMPAHCGTLVEEDIWQTSEKLSTPWVWLSHDQAKRFRSASLYQLQRKMHQKENWKTCLSSGVASGLCAHQKLQWELLVCYSDLHRHTRRHIGTKQHGNKCLIEM